MKKKRIARGIATLMLLAVIAFVTYALQHPEASFPWSNTITYILYGVYLTAMSFLFLAPFRENTP